MKRYSLIVIVVAAVIVVAVWKFTFFEKKPAVFWYHVKVEQAGRTLGFFGSSPLDERQFARQMAGQDFAVLEDLLYLDEQMGMTEVSDQHAALKDRVYLNPEYVIAFQPMSGDPREQEPPETPKR